MAITIKWNKRPFNQLIKTAEYIGEFSIQNAETVIKEILDIIFSLSKDQEKFPVDKYKLNNDGSFRGFELHHYRVSYRYKKDEISIIRIRHTKRTPQNYK